MIEIALLPQHLHLDAGARGRMAVTLHGPDAASARYALQVLGLEEGWYSISEAASVMEGGGAHAVLTLHPPAGAVRGVHVFEVAAAADDGRDRAAAEGTLVVEGVAARAKRGVAGAGGQAQRMGSGSAQRVAPLRAPAAFAAWIAALRGSSARARVLAAAGAALVILLATVLYGAAARSTNHPEAGCRDAACTTTRIVSSAQATSTAEWTPTVTAGGTILSATPTRSGVAAGGGAVRNHTPKPANTRRSRVAHYRDLAAALSGSPAHPTQVPERSTGTRPRRPAVRTVSRTPTAVPTRSATVAPSPTPRATQPEPTTTPTQAPTYTATASATATATRTLLPSATSTRIPTSKRIAPRHHTHPRARPATTTPIPPAPTATNTPTPRPSSTASDTPSAPTHTASPTRVRPRPTATRTATPTHTRTATPHPTPSSTPRPSATRTPRPRPTATHARPTETTVRTTTPRPTRTPRPTPSRTATATPRPTVRATSTATPAPQPSISTGYEVSGSHFILHWLTRHAVSFTIDGKAVPSTGQASFALQTHTFVLVATGAVHNETVSNVELAVADACTVQVNGQRIAVLNAACLPSPTPRATATAVPPSPSATSTTAPTPASTPTALPTSTVALPSTATPEPPLTAIPTQGTTPQ